MATATDLETGLAYDIDGSGTPVVFLHGLTFDRRTWRPVIAQLHGSVTSIAIDLPPTATAAANPRRERLGRLPDAQIEEWAGDGHFVHLVNADPFTTRLAMFVEHCDQAG